MNRELLAKVRDRIAEVGNEHCNMDDYTEGTMVGNGEPACGTTACIAGHVLALHYGEFNQEMAATKLDNYAAEAQRMLGLPNETLFIADWPMKYVNMLYDEGHAKGMLAVCDALLDGALVFDAVGNLIEAREF